MKAIVLTRISRAIPLRARYAWIVCAFAGMAFLASTSVRGDSEVPAPPAWQIETVDTSGMGRFTSLKVDSGGNVHVSYSIEDGNVYPLKYAIRSAVNQRWFTMTVARGAGMCSLALDSNQRPRIAWSDFGSVAGAKLRYSRWDGTAWHTDAVRLSSEVIAYYTSLALDPQDNPAIAFYEYEGPRESDLRIRLRSVIWNGTSWDLRTVDAEPGSGKFNSMAAGSNGHLHLAYANVSAVTAGIRYAFWNGQAWKQEIIEGIEETGGDSVGFSAAIAVDKDDNPRIAYMDETHPMLKYAARKNGRWQIQKLDTVGRVAYPDRNSIVIDDQNRTYISYYDAGKGMLKVVHEEGKQWVAEIVDNKGAGFTSSMQIAGGSIWISYGDEAGRLKVAHRKLVADPKPASPENKKTSN